MKAAGKESGINYTALGPANAHIFCCLYDPGSLLLLQA